MKKIITLICITTALSVGAFSPPKKVGNKSVTPLVEQPEQTFGWGKGRATANAYLSVSVGGGQIQSWRSIKRNDETTQSKVDIVFPGDWGNPGGNVTICNPVETGGGGAEYEYCTGWLRRKGTRIIFLPAAFQRAQFNSTKTVEQIKQIFLKGNARGWDIDTKPGTSFAIKTEDGFYAIAYISDVLGTYASTGSKIKLIIKVQP